MKSYTDIEQSKKLAKFLPLESADMHYATWTILDGEFIVSQNQGSTIEDLQEDYGNQIIPCWSLAALLKLLTFPLLKQDVEGNWLIKDYTGIFPKTEKWYDNPVDACVKMIENLYELKML